MALKGVNLSDTSWLTKFNFLLRWQDLNHICLQTPGRPNKSVIDLFKEVVVQIQTLCVELGCQFDLQLCTLLELKHD